MSDHDNFIMEIEMTPRWQATVFYRTDAGINPVDHVFEEISDLDELIERGPDWNTIAKIEIILLRSSSDYPLTIEEAATQ